MYYIIKRIEISGSHRLALDYESKCTGLHGHNCIITIYCKAAELAATHFTFITEDMDKKLRTIPEDYNPTIITK